jgi:Ca2+-binding RTX toxin-like protein
MVSTVTIQGSNHQPITLTFDTATNFALAQQIATYLNAEIASGKLVTEYDSAGPPPALPHGISGAYVQTTSPLVFLPADYTTDLITKSGSAVVFGSGAANETILSGASTSLTFIATAGSGTVVAGGGNDTFLVTGTRNDNWSLYAGGGSDIIAALGAVNATIGAGGGHNAIQLGSGNDLIISTGYDTVAGGSSHATIDATGAHSDFVQGESSDLLFVGGTGGATIVGGTGSDTYLGSAAGPVGSQLIEGGSAGNNFLFAGDGLATLVGGGKGDQLYGYGSYNQSLIAGSGNETLSAALSSGNDTLKAGSGKDVLIGGFGSDTFVGGSGHATITAGLGSDVFAFINHQAGGTELVQGIFDPASIKIDLQGYGPNAIADALASQTVKHGSVTIDLSDGTKVTFQDVTSLTRSNFT